MEIDHKIFDLQLFVCTNQKDAPKQCCANAGAMAMHAKIKEEIKKRGLNKKVRINKAGCLDQCSKGPAMVLYPMGKWYLNVTDADLPEIITEIEKLGS